MRFTRPWTEFAIFDKICKYFYREWFDNLPNGHNTVVVVVGVNLVTDDRFVLTAYPDYRPRP